MGVFFGPGERRLRAGWRLAGQTILYFGLLLAFSLPLMATGLLENTLSPQNLLINKLAETLALLGSISAARRWLDHRPLTGLGLAWDSRARRELLTGLGIAAAMLALVAALLTLTGSLHFVGFAWATQPASQVAGDTLLMLAVFVLVGFGEELWLRGYILQNLEDGLNLPWAVGVSSGIFAALHMGNPDASAVSTLGILLAGLLFVLAYARTRRLWLPIGIHIGWNFILHSVLGLPVSGLQLGGLLVVRVSGPALLTGGAFGPEAGVVVLGALGLGAWLVARATRVGGNGNS